MKSSETSCPSRSDFGAEEGRESFDGLFKKDWEVFVIRLEKETGKYNWFTQCCEMIADNLFNGNKTVPAVNR